MDDKAETEESALVYNQGECPILLYFLEKLNQNS